MPAPLAALLPAVKALAAGAGRQAVMGAAKQGVKQVAKDKAKDFVTGKGRKKKKRKGKGREGALTTTGEDEGSEVTETVNTVSDVMNPSTTVTTLTFTSLLADNFLSVGDDWYDVMSYNSSNNILTGTEYYENDSGNYVTDNETFSIVVTPNPSNDREATYVDSSTGEEGTITLDSTKTISGHTDVYTTVASRVSVVSAATRLTIEAKQNSLKTQKHPVWLLKNPLGTILNLLIIYSQWWAGIYAKNKSIALTIISVKILLITSLPPALAIFYWNHFGPGST